eukprot:369148_1
METSEHHPCKRIRIDNTLKDNTVQYARDLVLKSDTYIGCILSFMTTLEYLRSMVMVSKYYHNFIENKSNHQLIKKILLREFSEKTVSYFVRSSHTAQSIGFLYNLWMNLDLQNTEHCQHKHYCLLFQNNPQNIDYKSILVESSFLDRIQAIPPSIQTFQYWLDQYMNFHQYLSVSECYVKRNSQFDQNVNIILAVFYYIIEQIIYDKKMESNKFNEFITFYKTFTKLYPITIGAFQLFHWFNCQDKIFENKIHINYKYELLCIIWMKNCDYFENIMNTITKPSLDYIGCVDELLWCYSLIYAGLHDHLCCDQITYATYPHYDSNCSVEMRDMQQNSLPVLKEFFKKYNISKRLVAINEYCGQTDNNIIHFITTQNISPMCDAFFMQLHGIFFQSNN